MYGIWELVRLLPNSDVIGAWHHSRVAMNHGLDLYNTCMPLRTYLPIQSYPEQTSHPLPSL